ncbi:hypothetical protein SYNPS1DRAFT_24012, partial [Syncephalis pseudoplumigaleata]
MYSDDVDGHQSMIDFIWQARDNEPAFRQRYVTVGTHLIPCYIIAYVFARNSICVGKIIAKYPYKLAPWCCFCANLVGFLCFAAFGAPLWLSTDGICASYAWAIVVSISISGTLGNIMLFERAYVACQRSIWFILLGIVLVGVPGPAFVVAAWRTSTAKLSPRHACYLDYPDYLPYVRLSIDLPSNIVFSIIFTR